MTCPAPSRLAAAVSGEDIAVIEHTRDCLSCRAIVYEHRELLAAARQLPRPTLSSSRRGALAAEVMAQSDALETAPTWHGGRVMAVVAGAIAAAAVLVIMLAGRGAPVNAPTAPDLASSDEPAVRSAHRAHLEAVAPTPRADVSARGADFAREQQGSRDVVTLRDGELSVDATDREPITIVVGDTRVTIASSRAKVVARQGVIVTTHVFAGTAQVTTNGRSLVVDAGDVWMREPEASAALPPANDSLAAFRSGWEELRAHHFPQAIAAFDRATDPVVAEDAAFWAAIATERAGDLDGAAARLRSFLDQFPSSPRSETARAALERVTK